MKRLLLLFLLISSYCFSQSSGITYQAVIYNPNGEELPGVDNPYAPLVNQSICLQFGILDADGTIEYQEQTQVTTDAFGMVNLLIGTSTQTGGFAQGFTGIEWSADAKFLKVDLDPRGNCVSFEELSNQPFTYVPFAYYSPASDIPGPAGPQGSAGVDGQNGIDGQDGATGPAGPSGPVGPSGPGGANGQDGSTGPEGPSGPVGPPGPTGAQGPVGAQGDPGPQGANGLLDPGENTGDIVFWTGTDWTILPIGSEGDVLSTNGGVPSWQQDGTAAPPPGLQVCDFWGGGIVFYIAQDGDPIYVEGEIHGLIAPPYWVRKGFGTYSYNPLDTNLIGNNIGYYQNNAVDDIGGGEINNLIYKDICDVSLYDDFTPYGFCDNLVLSGFTDWYFPCASELALYLNLNTSCPEIGGEIIKGYYQHSGLYYPSLDIIIPGFSIYNTNCCTDQTRLVPIRKF
jgi:hypothetical protein